MTEQSDIDQVVQALQRKIGQWIQEATNTGTIYTKEQLDGQLVEMRAHTNPKHNALNWSHSCHTRAHSEVLMYNDVLVVLCETCEEDPLLIRVAQPISFDHCGHEHSHKPLPRLAQKCHPEGGIDVKYHDGRIYAVCPVCERAIWAFDVAGAERV